MSSTPTLYLLRLTAVAIQFNPLSPSSSKVRHLIPYLTSSSPQVLAQNTTYLPPKLTPPPKGPSPNFNLWVSQLSGLPAAKDGETDALSVESDSITVTYSDGHVVEVDVKGLKHVKDILAKIDSHARGLKARDEALQG